MSQHGEWTRESEAAALEQLRAAASAHRQTPIALVYTRQSVSDFDAEGRARGPSLSQQLDTVIRRPELEGLAFELCEVAFVPRAGHRPRTELRLMRSSASTSRSVSWPTQQPGPRLLILSGANHSCWT